jgi:hypothetical protein
VSRNIGTQNAKVAVLILSTKKFPNMILNTAKMLKQHSEHTTQMDRGVGSFAKKTFSCNICPFLHN